MYTKLEPVRIVDTLQQLQTRINKRFPDSGLANVCAELTSIAGRTQAQAEAIGKSDWPLRTLVSLVLATGLFLLLVLSLSVLAGKRTSDDLYGTLQGIDSAFNIVVLMGASLFFLVSLEDRRKRKRALSALQEVRSILHVIDMHQLTKDPSTDVFAETARTPPGRSCNRGP